MINLALKFFCSSDELDDFFLQLLIGFINNFDSLF